MSKCQNSCIPEPWTLCLNSNLIPQISSLALTELKRYVQSVSRDQTFTGFKFQTNTLHLFREHRRAFDPQWHTLTVHMHRSPCLGNF